MGRDVSTTGRRQFATTRWSLVLATGAGPSAQAGPARGRFRSFLLTSMQNFLASEWRRQAAVKRGGDVTIVSIDYEDAETRYQIEPAHALTPEAIYERRWALASRCLNALSTTSCDSGTRVVDRPSCATPSRGILVPTLVACRIRNCPTNSARANQPSARPSLGCEPAGAGDCASWSRKRSRRGTRSTTSSPISSRRSPSPRSLKNVKGGFLTRRLSGKARGGSSQAGAPPVWAGVTDEATPPDGRVVGKPNRAPRPLSGARR